MLPNEAKVAQQLTVKLYRTVFCSVFGKNLAASAMIFGFTNPTPLNVGRQDYHFIMFTSST